MEVIKIPSATRTLGEYFQELGAGKHFIEQKDKLESIKKKNLFLSKETFKRVKKAGTKGINIYHLFI